MTGSFLAGQQKLTYPESGRLVLYIQVVLVLLDDSGCEAIRLQILDHLNKLAHGLLLRDLLLHAPAILGAVGPANQSSGSHNAHAWAPRSWAPV